jgi:hypothetical protein
LLKNFSLEKPAVLAKVGENALHLLATLKKPSPALQPLLKALGDTIPAAQLSSVMPFVSASTIKRAKQSDTPLDAVVRAPMRSLSATLIAERQFVRQFWLDHCPPCTPGLWGSTSERHGNVILRYLQLETNAKLYEAYTAACKDAGLPPRTLGFFCKHRYIALLPYFCSSCLRIILQYSTLILILPDQTTSVAATGTIAWMARVARTTRR